MLDVELRRQGERQLDRRRVGGDQRSPGRPRRPTRSRTGASGRIRRLVAASAPTSQAATSARSNGARSSHDQNLHQASRAQRTGPRSSRVAVDAGSVSTRAWATISGLSSPSGFGIAAADREPHLPILRVTGSWATEVTGRRRCAGAGRPPGGEPPGPGRTRRMSCWSTPSSSSRVSVRPRVSSRSPSASEVPDPLLQSWASVPRPATGARRVVSPSSSSSSASSRRSDSLRIRCSRSSAASPRLRASAARRSAVASSARGGLAVGGERRRSQRRERLAALDPAPFPNEHPLDRAVDHGAHGRERGRPEHRLVPRDAQGPADQGQRGEQQQRRPRRRPGPCGGQRQQRLLRAASAPRASTIGTWWYSWAFRRATAVWLARIAGELALVIADELGRPRLEDEHAEDALLVLEREVESAAHLLRREVGPEDRDEEPLRVGWRVLAVAQVERLAPPRRPLGAGDQVGEAGVLGIRPLLAPRPPGCRTCPFRRAPRLRDRR